MDLSILIPARNEEFLAKTIQDILSNIEADTEVIAVLDGQWTNPPVEDNDRVNLIYLTKSIGQRAATNLACRLSKAKYVMKLDAHCALDKGFDRKMIEAFEEVGDDVVIIPTMRNLWAYDWVCVCGAKKYQDKGSKCDECGNEMTKNICWIAKKNPQSSSFCFDSEPHFQYFNDYTRRPGYGGDLTESMSIQGSCFMLARERYWDLNICDEALGSWGSQGIEVACKIWLSGGRVLSNHRTWYAHMFRTKPQNSFGFPYQQDESQIQGAKAAVKDLFFNNKWPLQKHPLSWLVEKFWPVRGWADEDLVELKKKEYYG